MGDELAITTADFLGSDSEVEVGVFELYIGGWVTEIASIAVALEDTVDEDKHCQTRSDESFGNQMNAERSRSLWDGDPGGDGVVIPGKVILTKGNI